MAQMFRVKCGHGESHVNLKLCAVQLARFLPPCEIVLHARVSDPVGTSQWDVRCSTLVPVTLH